MTYQRIGVVGAGSWGTALALVAARAGRDVTLWARDESHAARMTSQGENTPYLPGVRLPEAIVPTADRNALGGIVRRGGRARWSYQYRQRLWGHSGRRTRCTPQCRQNRLHRFHRSR